MIKFKISHPFILLTACFLILASTSCGNLPSASRPAPVADNIPGYPTPAKITPNAYPGSKQTGNALQKLSLNQLKPPTSAPQPDKGAASISGLLYSTTTSYVLPKTSFYLTSAIGDQNKSLPMVLFGPAGNDPRGVSDDKGQIELNNIPPGNYFLIVNVPTDLVPASTSEKEENPRLIQLKADQKYPLGILLIGWP